MSMNMCCFVGRIADELDLKETMNGVTVCSFRIAVNRNYANASGTYDTDFIPCTAWRDTAKLICDHFRKGSRISVVCSADVRIVIDDKSQRKYQCTNFTVKEVHFIDTKEETQKLANKTQSAASHPTYYKQGDMSELADDDELPFN